MSPGVAFLLFALIGIVVVALYLFVYPNWRRDRELKKGFPAIWRELLSEQVRFYDRLQPDQRRSLEERVQLFLAEKTFYGCNGFEVDDRVRLTIAGQACLLILHRPFSFYDDIRSILVYPDVYRARFAEEDGMVVHEGEEIRSGEASSHGQVVLAWRECEEAVLNRDGAHNVILHEFAHQLDYLDGAADGAPPLQAELAERWQRTMTRAYKGLNASLNRRDVPWLDPYGATEPTEFFAVLTEAFFQQPGPLHDAQPEVYAVLRDFYRLDPLRLLGEGRKAAR